MKVKQLLAMLSTLPQEAEVYTEQFTSNEIAEVAFSESENLVYIGDNLDEVREFYSDMAAAPIKVEKSERKNMIGKNPIIQKEKEMSLFDKFYEALACGVSATDLEKECIASIKEAAAKVEADRKQHEKEVRLEKAQEIKKEITVGLLKLLELYEIFDFCQLDTDSQDMLYTKAEELADVVGDLLIELGPRVIDTDFFALLPWVKSLVNLNTKVE